MTFRCVEFLFSNYETLFNASFFNFIYVFFTKYFKAIENKHSITVMKTAGYANLIHSMKGLSETMSEYNRLGIQVNGVVGPEFINFIKNLQKASSSQVT